MRAPLGVKTNNTKARAFQTQHTLKAEKTTKNASTTRKSIRSKIKIAPSESVEAEAVSTDDDDIPEIEYAPPPPVELPDLPIDWEHNTDYPQLRGANLCRGWAELYGEPMDEHGIPVRVKKQEELYARSVKGLEENWMRELAKPEPYHEDPADEQVVAMIAAGPKKQLPEESQIDTLRARGAANALSQSCVPAAALRTTASSLQKKKRPAFSVLGSKKIPGPTNPSPMRNASAAAISKNTIGFPRARNAPTILPHLHKQAAAKPSSRKRQETNQSNIPPRLFRELYGEPPPGSEMWIRFHDHGLFDKDIEEEGDLADDLYATDFFAPEDEEELFQLPMPAG